MERSSFGEENDSVFLQMEETKSQSWGGVGGFVCGTQPSGQSWHTAGLCGHKPLPEKLITGPTCADFTYTQKHIPILCSMEPQFSNTRGVTLTNVWGDGSFGKK